MKTFLPIVLLSFAGILGCHGSSPVTPTDVTGTWVITDGSRGFLPSEFKKISGKLVVNADGSFIASQLHLPHIPARLDSGSGVWKLDFAGGDQRLQLVFHTSTI